MPDEQFILIEKVGNELKLISRGFSEFEILGYLRFYEKSFRTNIENKMQNAPPDDKLPKISINSTEIN